jgi:hypothetical protein
MYSINTIGTSDSFAISSDFVDRSFYPAVRGNFSVNVRGGSAPHQFCILPLGLSTAPANMKYVYTYNNTTYPITSGRHVRDIGQISNSGYTRVSSLISLSDYETVGLVHLRGTIDTSVVQYLMTYGDTFGTTYVTSYLWLSLPGAPPTSSSARAVDDGILHMGFAFDSTYPNGISNYAYTKGTSLRDAINGAVRDVITSPPVSLQNLFVPSDPQNFSLDDIPVGTLNVSTRRADAFATSSFA